MTCFFLRRLVWDKKNGCGVGHQLMLHQIDLNGFIRLNVILTDNLNWV